MAQRNKFSGRRQNPADRLMRDQEVLRANRELAAYFKGRRTEREARAALKIIKAFVRERERQDPSTRPALPGVDSANSKALTTRDATGNERNQRKTRRTSFDLTTHHPHASEPKDPTH